MRVVIVIATRVCIGLREREFFICFPLYSFFSYLYFQCLNNELTKYNTNAVVLIEDKYL